MTEIRNIAGVLLLACLASGCATGRMADLRDCGRFSVGGGLGLDATAKVGCVTHPSLGLGSLTLRVGVENRYRFGAWQEGQLVWPVEIMGQMIGSAFGGPSTPLASYTHERIPTVAHDPEYNTSWLPVLMAGRWSSHNPFSFHEITDLEVGGTLGVVSAKIGINPLEILDLLLGCVGWDIAKDDPEKEEKPKSQAALYRLPLACQVASEPGRWADKK